MRPFVSSPPSYMPFFRALQVSTSSVTVSGLKALILAAANGNFNLVRKEFSLLQMLEMQGAHFILNSRDVKNAGDILT